MKKNYYNHSNCSSQQRKSASSFWIVILLLSVAFLMPSKSLGQVTLFQFNFENTTAVTVDNVTGTPTFAANGTGGIAYTTTAPCQGARMLTVDDWDTGDYYRFTVNTTGFANMTFSFCNRTDATTIGTFIVRVSGDAGANWTTVLATFTPTTGNLTLNTNTFPAATNNDAAVWIEIYKTNNANANGRDYILDSATLTGYRIPTITSFTPATTNCPGNNLVITGTNFANVTDVSFNGISAGYTVDNTNQITAIIPTGNTAGNITVTTAGGTATSSGTFTPTPINTVGAASSTPTLCINTPLTNITHTTTGATGIGTATGLPTGITATWASNSITISGTPSASGTFNYNIPLTGGCGSVNATGTITITAANTVGAPSSTPALCINTPLTSITHTTTIATGIGTPINLPAGVTANWASNTITISGTPTASGTFNYSIPLNGGCGGGNATGTITVTAANTAGSASSTPTLCINTPLTSSITHTTSGATGIGTPSNLPAGVTATWGSNTITISGTPTNSGTFNYSIPLMGGCGTINATGTINVTAANTVGTASSTPTLCINTSLTPITHSTTIATGIGTATGLPTGVTASWSSNTITISGTPTVSGTFNYNIPLTGGCGSATATGTIIVENPVVAAGSISGTATVCQGQNGVIYTVPTILNATNYIWNLPSGTSITAGSGTNTITVSFSAAATSGNITVLGTNSCGNGVVSADYPVTVNLLPVAAGSITGTPTVCQGQTSVSYSIPAIANATDYTWTLPSGATVASGMNTNSITVDFSTSATSGNITVQGTNACGNGIVSANYPVTVNTLSVAPTSISGTATICEGTSTSLSLVGGTSGTGATAQWFNDSCGGTSAGTGNSITVSPIVNTTYYLRYSGSCNTTACASVNIAVNPLPVAAGTISGIATICQGQNSVTYSVPAIANATGYTWTLPSGVSIASGSNTNSITVDFSASAVSGTISVFGTNGCGNGIAANYPIVVNPLPVAPGTISGTATVCQGQNGVVYSVPAIASATNYSWTLPNGATISSGANTNSITVDFSAAATSGNITVQGTNACGNGTVSANYAVTVNTLSVAPTSISGTTTICEGTSTSLSLVGGTSGTGATAQWFTASCGGTSAGTGNSITVSPTTTTTYYVRYSGTCNTTSCASVTVTVNPLPLAAGTISGTATICQGQSGVVYSVAAIANATNYIWTLPSGASIAAGAGTNTITVNYSMSATSGNITVQGTNACGNGTISANYPISVNITPSVTTNYSSTICSGATATVLPIDGGGNSVPAGTTFSWGLPSVTGGITGGTALSGQSSFVQTLTNSTNVQQTASYNVTASTNGCSTSTFSILVYVNPKPTISATPTTQPLCSGGTITPITLSNPNAVSGTIDYSWTRDNTSNITGIGTPGTGGIISGTLTNTTSTPQTTVFTAIATTDNNCSSDPFTVSVLVNPTPTATVSPSAQTICSGDTATITISGQNLAGAYTYTWTGNNPNVTGTLTVSGSTISGNLTNTTATTQIITFTVSATVSGCTNVIGTATFTVRPRPTITAAPLTQTLCGGIAISPITISNPNAVAGTTFSWSRDNTVNVTGMAANGTGSPVSGTLDNFTNSNQTVNFTLTATAGSCNTATTVQVIVRPAPQVVATPNTQTRCNATALTAINITNPNSLAGTTFTWTRNNTTALTGIATSGSGNSITGTLTNTTTSTQTTTFTITATAGNGCSNSTTATATIYAPLTAPVIGSSQTSCLLSTPGQLNSLTPVNGGSGVYTYQWQRSDNNVTYTNIAGATASSYQPPFLNFGADNTYYRLVVTNVCGTVTSNVVFIEVVSNVGFSFGVDEDLNGPLCPGSTFSPALSSAHFSTSAVRFRWSADPAYITPGSGGPVGTTGGAFFFIRTSSGTIGPLTVQNNTNATVITPLSVTPDVYNYPGPPSGSFICSTSPQVINVTIRPRPVATATVPSATICHNSSASIAVRGNITDAATTFVWSRSVNANLTSSQGSGNSGAIAAGSPFTIPDVLTNNTTTIQYVTYIITPSSNGCTGTPITVTIAVSPPIVPGTIASSQTICSGTNPAAFTQTAASSVGTLSYQWQSSTTGLAGSYSNIAGATSATYTATGVTVTTWYIRTATYVSNGTTPPTSTGVTYTSNSASCSGNTTAVIITINTITPGSISGTQTSCSPTASAITLSSVSPATGIGTITYQWESSTTDCNSGFTDIALNANNISYVVPAGLTVTTYFRRRDISTTVLPTPVRACSAYTNCVTVFINNVTGGTVGSDQTLCGNNPAAFTEITPATGSGSLTYQWQSNTTGCGGIWANITGATGAVYDAPAGLVGTTYYRRIAYSTFNSVQCSAASNCITVTLNNVTAGTISANRTVCNGGDPAAFTETVAATGFNLTYQWQISTTSSAGPWSDISGAINAVYDEPGPINQITYYRRVVTSTLNGNSCSIATTPLTIFINTVTPSVIAGSQNVCNGVDNPNAFTVTTPATGTSTLSYQWQSSTTGCSGPWTDIPLATSATYDSPSVTQTTYFQVRVTSTLNGVGCSAFSNCVEITSFGKVWNGSVNTAWNIGLNWTPNGVPDATHCVIIPNMANKPVISGINYEAFAHSLSILSNARLEVTSNNNITVTDFVNVNPTAQFIIRNNASLIQDNNSAVNTGSIQYTRTSRAMTRWGYVYWGSPIVENAFSQIPSEFDYKYRWQSGTLTGSWQNLTSTSQGEGFITRVRNIAPFSTGVGTVDFTFNGTPTNGIVNVPVDSYDSSTLSSAGNTVLLANPYPSSVDAQAFLTHSNNTELGGTLFFWTSITLYSGTGPYNILDYGSWNLSGGVGTSPATDPSNLALKPNGKIASGQGFFAQAFADGTISFNNQMRIPNFNTQFFRNANTTTSYPEDNRIWLNLSSNTTFRQMMVNYKDGATNGYDRLYDGNSLTSNEINIYSILENRNLVIQGRGLPFDENDIVPLGYRITNPGTYSIAIDELDGIFAENQNVYLRDKLLGIDHDLKLAPYTFNAAAGIVDNRFELVYLSTTLGTNPSAGPSTFATIHDNTIKVESQELIKAISIYDISGKLIRTYSLTESTNRFTDDFNYPNGVYIAKITLDNDRVVSKKLVH